MQPVARIGAAVAAAAIMVGVSSVSLESRADEDQGSQSEGNQNYPEKGSQGQGSQGQGQSGQEQGSQGATPGTTQGQTITKTATVQKVDKAGGKLTFKDADGKTFDVKPGPQVNLDRLHVGDRVTATYFEETAVAIDKSGKGMMPKTTQKTVQRGGVTAQQATVTAQIVSVDPDKNMVVIKGPQGKMHSLKVQDPDMQAQLRQIKAGDNVSVTYTQAVALSVEPAK
jgi:hypothetical protein